MAKVHEQDHEDPETPDNPEQNQFHEDPIQDTDIEDLLETHGQYLANMASTHISHLQAFCFP